MQQTYHIAPGVDEAALVDDAAAVVGDRWSLPILATLMRGPLRYTEVRDALPGIAPNILAARLRKLEGDRLLSAERYSERPPRFEYRLTNSGESLAGALRMLAAWAGRRDDEHEQASHEACGTPLELRWWCPTCAETVNGEADEEIVV
jgi:DNA-binding HxlR family transcriptional regulator